MHWTSPWFAVGALVALVAGAAILSLVSAPGPASEVKLEGLLVDAIGLGPGWYTRTPPSFKSETILFPCDPCHGPPWRGSIAGTTATQGAGTEFQETVFWMVNPMRLFNGFKALLEVSHNPTLGMLRVPPRFGSDNEIRVAWYADYSYNFEYVVEDGGYIGLFSYVGPNSGTAKIKAAISWFG